MKGKEGLEQIAHILTSLRENPPKELAGIKVLSTRDYKSDELVDLVTGDKSNTGLPASNVLYYDLEGSAWFCVRPSGTEPKVKFYFGVKGDSMEDAEAKRDALEGAVMSLVDEIIQA